MGAERGHQADARGDLAENWLAAGSGVQSAKFHLGEFSSRPSQSLKQEISAAELVDRHKKVLRLLTSFPTSIYTNPQ
jgi:hypothetical protein